MVKFHYLDAGKPELENVMYAEVLRHRQQQIVLDRLSHNQNYRKIFDLHWEVFRASIVDAKGRYKNWPDLQYRSTLDWKPSMIERGAFAPRRCRHIIRFQRYCL